MHVLLPIVAGIGNALMAVPMVRQLKQARPQAQITILARNAAMGEVFARLPEADTVIVTGTGLKGLMKLVLGARRRRGDVYLIPFPSNRWQYNLLAATSGAGLRVMHSYPVGKLAAMAFLPALRVPAVRGLHDVDQNLRLLEAMNITPQFGQAPVFALTKEDHTVAARLLEHIGIEQEPFIAIHAGSAQTVLAKAKRWPTDRYATLVSRLHQQSRQPVVLLEGPDERGVTEQIMALVPPADRRGVQPLALRGSLGVAGAILKRASLYVGTDSGLAHLSAAVGTPPVTLFAPADPDRVCPFGYRHLVVQPPGGCDPPALMYPWEATRPRLRKRPSCRIEGIQVEHVLQRVMLVLEEKRLTYASSTPTKHGL